MDAPHLPFGDGRIDRLFALNVLEHLDDLPRVIDEMHRVLRQGGACTVEVPYFASVSAFADPTHRRWFTYTTLDHFAPAAHTGWRVNRHTWFGGARFRVVWKRLGFGKAHRLLGVAVLANRFPALYENLFVYWFPARTLRVELQKL